MNKITNFFFKLFSKTFKLEEKWHDDLIWCPSQCYCYFRYNNIEYCIYLRWRWNDPWTANLIINPDSENSEWIELPVQYWTMDQLEELKKDSLFLTKAYLSNLKKKK